VTYVTACDPSPAASRDILLALGRGGADVIEVGVPFSDPLADGPVIQRATERALAAGGTLTKALELVASVRAELDVPLVLFTYLNPVLRLGWDSFAQQAASAGVDGVLLLDLPVEEAGAARETIVARGMDPIFLVSPTTSDKRLRQAGELGRGFLYAISRLGVTGARDDVASSAGALAARVRAVTSLPVAMGFGISRPEHVKAIGQVADAAVVGSAIVQVIADEAVAGRAPAGRVESFVRWLKE
jgi:tryptophan synthase alpha chain